MRYFLDFGTANAGGTPTFSTYINADTLAAMTQPTITEVGDGIYYFTVDWLTVSATSITYKATLNGTELTDTVSSEIAVAGSTSASAATSSTSGYWTVGPLIARALVRCGMANLTQAQIAAYDPFASTDAAVNQMVEILNDLGHELAGKIKAHLERVATFTTASSATSYALPADFSEVVPQSQWDRSSVWPMVGPVTAQHEQYLVADGTANAVGIQYRIQGNRITFPVAPSDGLSCALKYISRYWVQTASSGTGPDADHATARTDYVLFDPLLIVRGLRAKYLMQHGMPEAELAEAEYEQRLEWARGTVASAPVLSLSSRLYGFRFLDRANIPDTGYGA